MLKRVLSVLALVASTSVFAAAGHDVHLDKAPVNLKDTESLQRGMRLYQNYCLGCHQMEYNRYSRTFRDLHIPDEVGMKNLAFGANKVGDYIKNGAPKLDQATWFGAAPPDLTNVTRVRGSDWVYTYLRSFYVDPSRPFGVNNVVFPLVGMPHVLQELQGIPTLEHTTTTDADGNQHQKTVIVTDGSGELSTDEYDRAVGDLVNYLTYAGQPSKLESQSLGIKVMIFLFIFFIFAFLLKKEYWKDVH